VLVSSGHSKATKLTPRVQVPS